MKSTSDFIVINSAIGFFCCCLFSSTLLVALTSKPAQGRCPSGSVEQENHREQDQHRATRTHRDSAPALVRSEGPSDLISTPKSRSGGFSCDASWT